MATSKKTPDLAFTYYNPPTREDAIRMEREILKAQRAKRIGEYEGRVALDFARFFIHDKSVLR